MCLFRVCSLRMRAGFEGARTIIFGGQNLTTCADQVTSGAANLQMFAPKRGANASLRDFLPACSAQFRNPRATSFDFGKLR